MQNSLHPSSCGLPDQPLVSACVPTFQHASYIKNCLNSILEQETDFPFEILVGEDCSTDGTRETCIAYSEQNRIRLFLRNKEEKIVMLGKKTGRSNHLKSYESAKGKYICFCDGDDY